MGILQSGLLGEFVDDAMVMFGGANDVHIQLDKLFGWDKSLTATVSANVKVWLRPTYIRTSSTYLTWRFCLVVCLCFLVTQYTCM